MNSFKRAAGKICAPAAVALASMFGFAGCDTTAPSSPRTVARASGNRSKMKVVYTHPAALQYVLFNDKADKLTVRVSDVRLDAPADIQFHLVMRGNTAEARGDYYAVWPGHIVEEQPNNFILNVYNGCDPPPRKYLFHMVGDGCQEALRHYTSGDFPNPYPIGAEPLLPMLKNGLPVVSLPFGGPTP